MDLPQYHSYVESKKSEDRARDVLACLLHNYPRGKFDKRYFGFEKGSDVLAFCEENEDNAKERGFEIALEMLNHDLEAFIAGIFRDIDRIAEGDDCDLRLKDREVEEDRILRQAEKIHGTQSPWEQSQHISEYFRWLQKYSEEGQMAYWTLNEGVLSQKLQEFLPRADLAMVMVNDLKQVIPCFTKHPFLTEPEATPDIQP